MMSFHRALLVGLKSGEAVLKHHGIKEALLKMKSEYDLGGRAVNSE